MIMCLILQCMGTLKRTCFLQQQDVFHSAQVACAPVGAHVLVVILLFQIGRTYKMSATEQQYAALFGSILQSTTSIPMARCACVVCNSCTCSCSCRKTPELFDIKWEE